MPRSTKSSVSSDTIAFSNLGSSSSMKVRIIVIFGGRLFPTETKIVVPVLPSATISELQFEAVRRARILGLDIPSTDLVLHQESPDGPIAFAEDYVEDIVDSSVPNTFWVGEAQDFELPQNLVFIRWITPSRALDYRTLSAIPLDPEPVNATCTIKVLKQIAESRIYRSPISSEQPLVSNFKLELHLTACALSTTDEDQTNLADLGCKGSIQEPLNVFVIPTSGEPPDLDRPHSLWAFECSDRGIAAFSTCLQMLIGEIGQKPASLNRLLKVFFAITHFPPALQAVKVLATENKSLPGFVVVLATCLRELALRIVPQPLVGYSLSRALEGSRQIFSWIYSEYRQLLNEADDPEAALVRYIKFEELEENPPQYYSHPGERCEVVEFHAAGGATLQEPSSKPRSLRKIRVHTHASCQENFSPLALAMWGNYDFVENFYVDFRDSIERPFDHRRTPLFNQFEFNKLLVEANNSDLFQMISPLDLDRRTSPGISLCKAGYVSLFSIDYGSVKGLGGASESHSTLENAITGSETLGWNPGRGLLQTLQPVIAQRKAEGTWDIDDWDLKTEAPKTVDMLVEEAVVICFDLSISMNSTLGNAWVGNSTINTLSRLDEAKQVFRNVIARLVGYHLAIHTGLVTFGSRLEVKIRTELSRPGKEFKDEMEHVSATGGSTALWDALKMAHGMLAAYKTNNPKAKLRIIALTDGEDNHSITPAEDVCKMLYDSEIILDSIVIGTNSTTDLFKISKHTGGYAFCPSSRLLLFQTFLLEPFLDISARPDIQRVPITDYATSRPKAPDMQTVYDFPPSRPHPMLNGDFISLSQASRFSATRSSGSLLRQWRTSTLGSGLVPDGGRLGHLRQLGPERALSIKTSYTASTLSDRRSVSFGKVCMDEMRLMIANPHPSMDVYVNESEMSFWKVAMDGPAGSPYERGTFLITIDMTDNFPRKAPIVRFVTPILHPNITKHGRICHAVLGKNWKQSYHIYEVMQHMYGLLMSPETDDAVDELATLKFWTDREMANEEIRKYVNRFAGRSRESWRTNILARTVTVPPI